MQIAARRIVAQRPGRSFKILPCADPKGELQKQAKRSPASSAGRAAPRRRERPPSHARRAAAMRSGGSPRTADRAKAARSSRERRAQRVAVRRVFGALVIAANIRRQAVGILSGAFIPAAAASTIPLLGQHLTHGGALRISDNERGNWRQIPFGLVSPELDIKKRRVGDGEMRPRHNPCPPVRRSRPRRP